MKKIMALCISGLIALCFSMSLHAQSSQQDLDQVELMKQLVGSWTAETGVDSTLVWEAIPSGKGYEENIYFKVKGETYETAKGIIGFSQEFQTVNMVFLWENGGISYDIGKFVSDKRAFFERFDSDPSHVTGTMDYRFLTPSKFTLTFKMRGAASTWDDAVVNEWTWTFIRTKK
jgi:hypothetical protein